MEQGCQNLSATSGRDALQAMKVFLGDTRGKGVAFLRERGWGRMFAKDRTIGPLYPFERWAFDNGAFEAYRKGFPFPEEIFLKRLDAALKVNSDPTVAVVPDKVAKGMESLEFSLRWRERLPDFWPWYLAVQDGMTHDAVLEVAHLFAGIFLGGTDRFKWRAYSWCRLAHFCDKPFHYGRAGTLSKLRHAFHIDADSLDSNFPLWTKQRRQTFADELLALQNQDAPRFEFATESK